MPPLPWKKAGFSRLVTKQGGSLVVETGFPTSLVDLFVKNRGDEIKRSSKMKKRNRSIRDTESIAADSCPASPAKSITSPIRRRMAPSRTISRNPSLSSFSGSPVAPVCVGDAIGDEGKSVRAKKVFVGMLKILFLVVLALGKKQFAIDITLSAFLLHIMEFLGKCLYRLLEQYEYVHFSFRHFLEQVMCNLRSKNGETEQPTSSIEEENQTDDDDEDEEEANSLPPLEKGNQLRSETIGNLNQCKSLHMDWISEIIMNDTAEELLEMERNRNKNLSRKIKSKIMKLWVSKKKQEEDPISEYDYDYEYDSEEEEEVADEKPLKKGIKAKFNMIIPSKLNILKKKQTYQKKSRSTMYERFESTYERFEQESDSQTIDNLYEQESFPDDDQILSFNNDDISSSSSDESEMEESPKKKEQVFCEKETMWTMEIPSFVFLIPIILVGLEGGRFWAIVFTMIFCLVFKFVTMSSKFLQLLAANL